MCMQEDEPASNVDSTAAAKNQALYGEDALKYFGQSNANLLRPVQRGEVQSTDSSKDLGDLCVASGHPSPERGLEEGEGCEVPCHS